MSSEKFCCFEVLHNDRLVRYLSSIGLWAIAAPDAEAKVSLDAFSVYRFLVADWQALCNRVDAFSTHVIAIGVDDADVCVEAFKQGCFDYVRATSFVELGARLQRLAQRCEEWTIPTSSYWQLGDHIVLDTAAFVVKRGDVPAKLTPKAFLLLAVLEDDRYIPRERLAELAQVSKAGVVPLVVQINRTLGRIIECRPKYGYKLSVKKTIPYAWVFKH